MVRLALLLVFVVPNLAPLAAEDLDAAEIMARVAENQDRAVELRKSFVYHQTARVRLFKTNGKLLWDETREYEVTPSAKGSDFEMTRLYGERRQNGKLTSFQVADVPEYDGRDPEMVESFHDDLARDGRSRDGLSPHFFPLTSKEQQHYQFTLEGEEEYHRRHVYRLRFEPHPEHVNERIWKGEVLVDQDEFQPVFVATDFALKIPAAVRFLFGINVRQVGFSVSYDRFAEGVWFPISYGGEFRVKLFHFYKRNIIVSMVNEDFRRTQVASDIEFEKPVAGVDAP